MTCRFQRNTHLQAFTGNSEVNALIQSMLESITLQYVRFHEDTEQAADEIRLWLRGNQGSILKLADFYGKKPVFSGVLPISISVGKSEISGTAIHDRSGCHLVMGGRCLSMLFQGYFNNKMTLLVFLTQAKTRRLNEKSASLVCGFLDDMYRHMLPDGMQRKYRLVFLWLRKFFFKLPDVTAEQRSKAIEYIRSLYEVFGINLNKGGRNETSQTTA